MSEHLSERNSERLFTRREAISAIGLLVASIMVACKGEVDIVAKSVPDLDKSQSPKSSQSSTEVVAEGGFKEKRKLIYGQFVEAASNVVEKTKDPEAAELLGFLNKNVIFAEPVDQGIRVIENSTQTTQWVAVVVLLSGDELKGDHWKHVVSEIPAAGQFLPYIRALLVDGIHPTSNFTKGIIFLHEAYHAKHWIELQYDWKDIRTFCMKEVETHEFENRITSKFGGESYQHVLEEEVKRQLNFLKAQHFQVGAGSVSRSPYDDRLDKIFGPALSKMDKDSRQTNLWIHANFVLLERYFEGDVENQKGLFLKTIYDKAKILPGQQDK